MYQILAEISVGSVTTMVTGIASVWGPKILLALITLVVGWIISGKIGYFVRKQLKKKEIDPTLVPFLSTLVSTLIKACVVISAISTLGIEATSFAALFAAAGLAVGMALSGTLQNFAGGVIILILRPFNVGDVIEAQGYTGKVEEIKIFETILLTPDNRVIHIPNGKLQNDSLINYSTMEDRRVDFVFGIGYNDDIDEARKVIRSVVDSYSQIKQDPEPFIMVGELADSSVNFTVRLWANAADYWDVHFGVIEDVKKALDKAGISIPFPQQDVHMHQAG